MVRSSRPYGAQMRMGLFLSSAKRRVNRNAVRGAGGQNNSASDTRISDFFMFCVVLLCFALYVAWFALRVPPAVTRLTVYRWLQVARRTCFTEQYYTGTRRYCCAGKIAGKIRVKLCMIFWWFFFDISSIMNSFGPASRLPQDIISLHPWNAAGPPGNIMGQRI